MQANEASTAYTSSSFADEWTARLCANAEMQRILFIEITISFKLMSRLLFRLSHVNFAHKTCQIVRRVGRSGLSRCNCEFSLTILFCNFGERAAHLPFHYGRFRAFERIVNWLAEELFWTNCSFGSMIYSRRIGHGTWITSATAARK